VGFATDSNAQHKVRFSPQYAYCFRVSDASGIEPADVPRLVPLRSNAGFRMLWIGQLLSDTGSQIGLLAYSLLILALTHSAVLAGVVGTTRAVTRLCLQLPAGALATGSTGAGR
jgi:hypothetical protein